MALCSMAAAQTARFVGSESSLPITPAAALQAASVVVDASGNVYVSDFGNDQVVELTPTSGGYTQTTVASSSIGGLVSPRGLALDSTGNLYIADFGGKQILKVACAGGSCGTPSVLVTGLGNGPQDVAFNPYGYLWFTMSGDQNVWMVPASGGTLVNYSATYFSSTPFSQPIGLAWQTTGGGPGTWTGNLFISDYNASTVTEWTWNGSAWGLAPAVPTSGLTNPARIAVDSTGNLYIADSGNNRVVEAPWTGSAWDAQVTVPTSPLNQPVGVTVDSNKNIYIADWQNHRVLKESLGAANFATVPVASTSQTIPLFFTFNTAANLGSTAVLTQGTAGLDFADAHTGTCTAGHAYSAGDSCSIGVTFRPRFAGPSYGAAILKDGAGNVLATGFVYGIGSGPQVNFLPGAESTLTVSGSASPQPIAHAVDASGNVYISDYANNQVVKEAPAGGGYTQTTVVSGLTSPRGVAVDGAGNVYVADFGGQQLYVAPWNGSAYGAKQALLAAGTYSPAGIAFDGSGDVFFTNWGSSNVYELSPGGSPTVLSQFSALSQPLGIALDAAGNLFVSDYTGNKVVELQWTGGAWDTLSTVPTSGLSNPARIAVDGAENIYIADSGNNRVVKAPWNGAGWGAQVTVQTGSLNSPQGVALDGSGNIYVVDFGNNRVIKEDYADAPSLSFAPTVVTETSTDSPQTVTAANIGNRNLLFTGSGSDPAYPADFPENAGHANLCASGTPLAPAATCDLSVNFIPTIAGNLSEDLVLTDNHLNAAGPGYATQFILLSGTGLPQPTVLVAPSSVPFSDQVQGTTANAWTLTLNNTSSIPVLGISMSIVGTNPTNFAFQSSCGSALAPYSTCIVTVTFTPTVTGNTSDYYSATLRIDDDAVGHPQTVPLSGTGTAMTALLSPNYVDFGTQTVGGTSAAQTVILTNASSGTLTIGSIAIGGSGSPFAISSTTCAATLPVPSGTTLGPNSNCTITMTFTPASATSYSGTLTVTDNGQGGTQTVALSGTGAGQNVFLSPTSIGFSNQTAGSTSNAWTVTFNNTSNLPVTGVSVSIGGSNPADFAQTNTCGTTLAANSTCNIFVTFTPQSAAYFSGTLVVAGSAGTQTATLGGTGTAATSALAPNQLNFGSVKQGTASSAQVATLTNTSGGPLTFSTPLITSGSANFSISANTCVSPLAAYATCAISVVFTPSGVGDYTGTLTVTNSGANSPLTTSLVGTGTSNAASAFFSPASINFGSQTVGSTGNNWGVTLNNTGSAAITGLSVSTGNSNFTISSNTCGTSLAANSVCSLQIAFTPTALGSLSGSLTATYSGGSLSAPLSGVGIAPTVSLAPGSLNFGNQVQGTTSSAQLATLTNTSAGPVTISAVSIGGNASDFTKTNNCPATLAANASCTISVAFTPQAAGSFTATLYIFDTAGSGQQSVTLTGTGTSSTPSGYFSPTSINFGNQTVGSTSQAWGMTLNNNGSVAMQNVSVSASGDFSIPSGSNFCAGSLAVGFACSFQVTFTPSATGARSGTVTALFTNGSLTAGLTGTGISPTVAVAPNSLNFGNVTYGNRSSDQAVTVTNTSAGPVGNIGITVGSGPFFVDTGASNCGASLPAYASCTIWVYYSPSAATSQNGTLTITDNAAGGLQTVGLSGVGISASQYIAFTGLPATATYGAAGPYTLSGTASSGLPVTYSLISGPATVVGSTLTITGAGSVTVAANQAGNANFAAAPQVTQTIWISPAVQTITFPQPASPVDFGTSPLTLTATASSGLPVTYTVTSGPATVVGSTLTYTGAGTVVVQADQPGNANIAAAASVSVTITVTTGFYTAPTEPVGTASAPQTATILFTSGFTLGSINVVTQGTPNLDFKPATGGTCTVGTAYTAGQSCTVNYIFKPTAPGARLGAITIYDNTTPVPVLESTTFLAGTGNSGLGLFTTGVSSTLASGLSAARGVSLDAAGNIYVSEQTAGKIDKFAAGTLAETTLVSGINGPSGTAVDGAGNIYYGSYLDNKVYELVGGGGTPVAIASGWSPDNVLKVDGLGNLYSPDAATGAIHKIATGTHAVTTLLPGGTISRIIGMAIDAAGNLYPADFNNNKLYKIPAGTSTPNLLVTGNGLSSPDGVAIDPAGNLYVTNYTGNVIKYAAGTHAETDLQTGNASAGIAIDGKGNLYTFTGASLTEYIRTATPALTLATTAYGSTSAEQVDGFENDGNAALTISALAATTNFNLSSNTTCATGSFAVAGTCNLAVVFAPTAVGPFTGTVDITDNTLNVAATLQQIALNGTATQGSQTISFTPPSSPVTYGVSPITLLATGGGSSSPVVFSVVSGPGTVTGSTLTINGAGNVIVAANQAGDANYTAAAQVTQTIVVSKASQTITFTGLPATATYGAAGPYTLSATASSGLPVTYFTYVSGPATVSGSTLTIIGAGTVVVAADRTGNANYTTAPQVTQTIVVSQASQTIVFTPPSSPVTYGVSPITLSATGGGSSSLVVFSVVSGPATVVGSALTITGAGTVIVAANQAGDANYTAAAQVTQTLVVNHASQTITFTGLPGAATYGAAGPYTLSGTATSGLAVTYSLVSGPGSVTGSTLTITGAGTVIVAADQAGDTNYTAAPQATQTIAIGKATPSTSLNCAPNSITYQAGATQTAMCTATVGGGATGTVTFYWKPQGSPTNNLWGVQTLSGGSASLTGFSGLSAGTYTLEADYAGDGNNLATTAFATEVISQAIPTVTTWPTASPITNGQQLGDSLLSYTTSSGPPVSSVPGTFAWTNPNTFESTGTPTESITFTPTDTTDYTTVVSSVPVTVNTVGTPVIGGTNFTVAANQTAFTLKAGQKTTVTLAFIPLSGYVGTVALSCPNLPDGINCSFAPASLTADGHGAVQTSQLTITTVGVNQSAAPTNPANRAPSGTALAGILLFPGLLFGGVLAWQRRKLSIWAKQLLIAGILASTLAGFSGCGGAGFVSTLTGMHQITIAAKSTTASGTTTQTGVLTLTITQ